MVSTFVRDAVVPLLLTQVGRCLGALRNELRIAAACLDTLRTLAERAVEDKARLAG